MKCDHIIIPTMLNDFMTLTTLLTSAGVHKWLKAAEYGNTKNYRRTQPRKGTKSKRRWFLEVSQQSQMFILLLCYSCARASSSPPPSPPLLLKSIRKQSIAMVIVEMKHSFQPSFPSDNLVNEIIKHITSSACARWWCCSAFSTANSNTIETKPTDNQPFGQGYT